MTDPFSTDREPSGIPGIFAAMEGAAAWDAKRPALRDADTRTVRLSREDILVLIDMLDTTVGARMVSAQEIEDDATGAREADPEWADLLDRQACRERDRAARLASLRDRIGAAACPD